MENKNYKGLVWLIVILIILVVALMGVIVYREFYSEEKLSADNTTTTNIVVEDDSILEEETIEYLLNNKQNNITFKYELKEYDEEYYGVYVNVYLNDKKVTSEGYPIYFTRDKDNYSEYKNYKLTKNNLNVLTNDKDYLVISIDEDMPTYISHEIILLVNEQAQLIDEIELGFAKMVLEDKELENAYNGKKYYIINNELRYLEEFSDEECTQWIITIKNNKVEVLSQGYYMLESIAGGE